MAGRNVVLGGAAVLGLGVVGAVVWLTFGGSGGTPATPEVALAKGPDPSPAAPGAGNPAPAVEAAPAPAGRGVLLGRLVRGAMPAPVPGSILVTGPAVGSRTATAGADGRFRLEGLPLKSPFDLVAASPGLVEGRFLALRVPDGGTLDAGDLVLAGPQALEVLVRDRADHPVAGAAVALHRQARSEDYDWVLAQVRPADPPAALAVQSTDASGRAAFTGAPGGEFVLAVAAKGFAPTTANASLVEGRRRDPVRVILVPECLLTGRVLRRGGKPVPGAVVTAFNQGGGWGALMSLGLRRGTTDAEGRYRLDGLPVGKMALRVQMPSGTVHGAPEIDLPAVTVFDVIVEGGVTLKGKVLDDATGEPVPTALVTAQIWNPQGGPQSGSAAADTGPDGTFLFEDLPTGNLGWIQVKKDGYLAYPDVKAEIPNQNVPLAQGAVVERDVRLRRGSVLRGKVTSKDGIPVPYATVVFMGWHPNRGMMQSPKARTAEDGTYRIATANPCRGLVQVTADGYYQTGFPQQPWQALQTGSLPEEVMAEVPAEGEAVKDIVLASGATIEGTVVDRDGKRLAGLSVGASSKKGTGGGGQSSPTDAEGKFRIRAVQPSDEIVVNAYGPGGLQGASDPLRVAEGDSATGVRITVEPGGVIAGTVRREDGKPGQGAALRLASGAFDPRQAGNWQWQERSAPAHPVGAEGAFRIEGVAPGKYTILCSADGCGSVTGPVVELAKGEAKEGVEVVLPAEKTIAGKAVTETGEAVPAAAISVAPEGRSDPRFGGYNQGAQSVSAVTDPQGKFEIRGLAPGDYRLTFRATGLVDGSQAAAAGTTDLVVTLKPGVSIAGVVVEEGAGPVANLVVSLQSPQPGPGGVWRNSSATTGKDGSFTFGDLGPGQYTVTAGQQWGEGGGDWVPKVVPNVEAGTKDLRIEVRRGATIAGKLVDDEGKAVAEVLGIQVVPQVQEGKPPDWSKQRWTQSKADGSFRVQGLEPGAYDLSFNSQGQGGGKVAPTSVKGVSTGTEDLVVRVARGLPITGRVVDDKGVAKGGGNLLVRPSGSTDGREQRWIWVQPEGGNFTTEPLDPSKSYDLVAQNFPGFMGGAARGVAAGSKDVTVVLLKGGSISGRVLDEAGAAVGAGVPIQAGATGPSAGGGDQPGRGGWAATREDGTFTLEGLGEFKFRLTAGGQSSDYAPTAHPEEQAVGATGVEIRVKRGVTFSGRLLDAAAKPIKGANVQASSEGGGGSWAQTDQDGRFTVKGIPAGKVTVRAWLAVRGMVELGAQEAPASNVDLTVPEK